MENDLIRRSDALAAFAESTSAMPEKQGRRRIEEIPAADAVEVKHGRWIDTNNYFCRWKCSACGMHTKDVLPNYCGWCGAKMDRKDGDWDA